VLYTESKPDKIWLRSLEFGMPREEYPNYKRPTTGRITVRLALTGSSPVSRIVRAKRFKTSD